MSYFCTQQSFENAIFSAHFRNGLFEPPVSDGHELGERADHLPERKRLQDQRIQCVTQYKLIQYPVCVKCPFFSSAEGPQAEVFSYTLTADNSTVNEVNMGDMGGLMDSVSEVDGDTLVTYLVNRENKKIEVVMQRMREAGETQDAVRTLCVRTQAN